MNLTLSPHHLESGVMKHVLFIVLNAHHFSLLIYSVWYRMSFLYVLCFLTIPISNSMLLDR